VVLFDSEFWKGFLDWLRGTVLTRGFISEEDMTCSASAIRRRR